MLGTILKLLITTSREPSRRTRSFLKDLVQAIPHSIKFNRGKATLLDLALIARRRNAYGVLMILEKRANPSALVYSVPTPEGLKRVFLMKITSVTLIREMPDAQKPLSIRRLIINPSNISGGLLEDVASSLVKALRPEIVENEVLDAVEVVLGESEEGVLVNFICTSTGRPCGPRFMATKVINYVEG